MSTRKPRGAATKTEQAAQPQPAKKTRQQKIGRVTSNKMQKTIVVAVESLKQHRVYKRTYKYTTKFKAHDERNDARIGDIVRIEETRPLSKEKRWRLVEILKRAEQTVAPEIVAAELEQSVGLTPVSDER
jgi:small subunit ribosomal protein S17